MARPGFIHGKLEIKMLVLYLMTRVEAPIDFSKVTDLTLCDDGIDYFDFAEALDELVRTDHLTLEEDLYAITEKGLRNGEAFETTLPFTVRQKCDENLQALNAALRFDAQVRAEILSRADGFFTLRLSLDDNDGNLLTVELFAPSEQQAKLLGERFRSRPDRFYHGLLGLLQDDA